MDFFVFPSISQCSRSAEAFAEVAHNRSSRTRNTQPHPLSLDLGDCYIGAVGAKTLSAMLQENPRLRVLRIDSNSLEDKGIEHVAKALEWNNELIQLGCRHNHVTNRGAQALSRTLPYTILQVGPSNDTSHFLCAWAQVLHPWPADTLALGSNSLCPSSASSLSVYIGYRGPGFELRYGARSLAQLGVACERLAAPWCDCAFGFLVAALTSL